LKAHRAYLYEIVHPLRIEVRGPDGANYDGGPLLDQLTDEKEVGLYVDYDAQLGTFTGPTELVDEFAAFCRFSTIAYLAATADAVRRALLHEDQDFRFREFGTLAMRICSEQIYQQDWPGMRDRFAATSPRHQALIADLTAALASVSTFFQKVQARRHGPGPEAPAAEA